MKSEKVSRLPPRPNSQRATVAFISAQQQSKDCWEERSFKSRGASSQLVVAGPIGARRDSELPITAGIGAETRIECEEMDR